MTTPASRWREESVVRFDQEGKTLSDTHEHSQWYRRIAVSMKLLVSDHDGVAVIESASVRPLLAQQDERMKGCPGMTLDHFTLSLRRQKLASRAFEGVDREVLLVFDQERYTEEQARAVWREREQLPLSFSDDKVVAYA